MLTKLLRYCAYRERCLSEVKAKLAECGAGSAEAGKIIKTLLEEGYVNEERYARSYVRGKFRINGWGRLKIQAMLRAKHIPENLIQAALREEISQNEYLSVLKKTVAEKGEKTALSRGFENFLIFDAPKFENRAD